MSLTRRLLQLQQPNHLHLLP
ncbi:hypothetical protein LINPERPRIM_LOCUS41113 [Linum perenne]